MLDPQRQADAAEQMRWRTVGMPWHQKCLACGKSLTVSRLDQATPVIVWQPEYRRHLEVCPKLVQDGTADMRAMLRERAGNIRARRSTGEPPKLKAPRESVQSRPKGASYENVIAKLFMRWYGGIWRRTPQSGGWMKGQGFDVPGDLVCTVPTPFHVECKNREGWDLTDLITGVRQKDSRSIIEWWKQTVRESPAGKKPMLVFRRNHLAENLLMMWADDFSELNDITGFLEFLPMFRHYLDDMAATVVIVCLSHFMAKCRPPKQAPHHKTWQEQPLPLHNGA